MVGEEYTIADIAIFPWFQQLRTGYHHSSGVTAKEFLSVEDNYPHVVQWAERILARPAVQRGMQVGTTAYIILKSHSLVIIMTLNQVCGWNSTHTKPWLQPVESNDL